MDGGLLTLLVQVGQHLVFIHGIDVQSKVVRASTTDLWSLSFMSGSPLIHESVFPLNALPTIAQLHKFLLHYGGAHHCTSLAIGFLDVLVSDATSHNVNAHLVKVMRTYC